MALLPIAEIFGHSIDDHTAVARQDRVNRHCPFRNEACTKGSANDPLGVCSLSDGKSLAIVCPVRFIEGGRVFKDVGRLAFGPGVRIIAAPEVRILRVTRPQTGARQREHRVGKVDYLVARLDHQGRPTDFAALEVQAVYFSGGSLRHAFGGYMRTGQLPKGSERRPDWRSSAQKRLMPQLGLKIPVFRRWGKKFFVAVDSHFFGALPAMRTVDGLANSEVTWLVYPFAKARVGYAIGDPNLAYTTWDDVLTALREGVAPDPAEILAEIRRKNETAQLPVHLT